MYDRKETTDDHGMVIVGRAVDQKGNRYYKVQNSWDTNQLYNGFIYVSEPYLLAKTMDIMVHRDAIPAEISLGLMSRTRSFMTSALGMPMVECNAGS